MTPDIKIRTLIGPAIKTYVQSIAKIRQEILSELPYLQLNSPGIDLSFLKHVGQNKDAIGILVFDGPKIVGASTGMPLATELPGFQDPFLKLHLPVDDYYYFGLSALLKPYRGRGLAHHFFDIREEHARNLRRFSKICFTSIVPPQGTPSCSEQANMETFWQKRGYVEHPEMTCCCPIPPSRSAIFFKFWIKDLYNLSTPHPLEKLPMGHLKRA